MKRKAEFSLDRKAIEKEGLEYEARMKTNLNESVGRIQTPEEIAQRRFLKIKGLKPCLDQKAPQKSVFHLAKPLETSILEPNKTEFSFLTSNSNPKEAIKEKKPQNNFEKVNTTPVNESHLSFFKSENSNPHSNANASLNSILNIETSAQKSSDSPKLVKQSLPFIVEYHNPQSKATSENTYEKVPEKAPEEQILFNNKIKPEEKILNPTEKNSNEKITKNIEEKFSQEKTLNKNVEDHKTENDQTGSKKLFGFKTENDSLTFSAFSNTNNNNPTHPSLFQQTSLFQQPSTNLFGSNAIKPTTNLFGNTPASGNLFGNLFQQKPNENSSLSFLNNLKKDSDDEDGSGNSDDAGENEECDSPEIDPTQAALNFKYEELSDKICNKKVSKFKVNEKDAFEAGTISLEKVKDANTYIVLYRNQAKLVMYRGWLYKKYSVIGSLNRRADSMTLVLFTHQKDNEENKNLKFSKDICKLMFGSQTDCEEFKKEIEKILKEDK